MVLLDLPFQCLEHGEDSFEETVPGEELGTKALGRSAVDYDGVVAPEGWHRPPGSGCHQLGDRDRNVGSG